MIKYTKIENLDPNICIISHNYKVSETELYIDLWTDNNDQILVEINKINIKDLSDEDICFQIRDDFGKDRADGLSLLENKSLELLIDKMQTLNINGDFAFTPILSEDLIIFDNNIDHNVKFINIKDKNTDQKKEYILQDDVKKYIQKLEENNYTDSINCSILLELVGIGMNLINSCISLDIKLHLVKTCLDSQKLDFQKIETQKIDSDPTINNNIIKNEIICDEIHTDKDDSSCSEDNYTDIMIGLTKLVNDVKQEESSSSRSVEDLDEDLDENLNNNSDADNNSDTDVDSEKYVDILEFEAAFDNNVSDTSAIEEELSYELSSNEIVEDENNIQEELSYEISEEILDEVSQGSDIIDDTTSSDNNNIQDIISDESENINENSDEDTNEDTNEDSNEYLMTE